MSEPPLVQPPRPAARGSRPRSLVLVNTGDGKGKSTAAFGVVMRAVARELSVWKVGEEEVARRLGVEWLKGGDGFTWESPDLDRSEGRARAAWQLAKAAIGEGRHQLVVLDEVTYPMNWGWIDGGDVLAAIAERPAHVNIVATGRDAPAGLVELADTVTEMVNRKHAYERGITARRGIDF